MEGCGIRVSFNTPNLCNGGGEFILTKMFLTFYYSGAAFGYRCYSDRTSSVQMSAVRAAASMAEEHVVPLALGNLTPKDVAK